MISTQRRRRRACQCDRRSGGRGGYGRASAVRTWDGRWQRRPPLAAALALTVTVALGTIPARADFLNPNDFASLGAYPSGSIGINTDTDVLTVIGTGTTFTGVSSGGAAVFTFDSINLGSIFVSGSRALVLLSKGDITDGATVSVAGNDFTNPPVIGGPGGGNLGGGGANGGFGGAGTPGAPPFAFGNSGNSGSPGGLIGGAGNGLNPVVPNGGGGGAIEFVALGNVTISGALLAGGGAAGGAMGIGSIGGGGGGGGGGISIKGNSVTISGNLSATGGAGGFAGRAGGGGGGGGGYLDIAAGTGGLIFSGMLNVSGGGGGNSNAGFGSTGGNGGMGGKILLSSVGTTSLNGSIDFSGGSGVAAGANGSLSVVPEPSAFVLTACGALGLLGVRLFRKPT